MTSISRSVQTGILFALSVVSACATDLDREAAVDERASSANARCPAVPHSRLWARTELYFGMSKPDKSLITEDEYQRFLDTEVTPRFGDGFTLLSGRGQFLSASGAIIKEPSKLLILLYPSDKRKSAAVDEIRTAFRTEFQQQSVLRVDEMDCVAF